jgi:hypothetical protein
LFFRNTDNWLALSMDDAPTSASRARNDPKRRRKPLKSLKTDS